MDERLEEIKIYEAMKETILKKEPDEDKQWLINRVDELQEENQELRKAGKFFECGYRQYEEENKRYKEALEFYADEKNYDRPYDNEDYFDYLPSELDFDKGEKARQALGGDENA